MRQILLVGVMAAAAVVGVRAQDQVYKIGPDVTSPVLVHEVRPEYTKGAMDRGIQGTVELSTIVERDGSVQSASVTKSLDPDLDQQAIAAVQQWTFKPGKKGGEAVRVEVAIELSFTLKKSGGKRP